MNKLALCWADVCPTVLCRQTVYLQLSSFHFRPVCWYVFFTPCPGDAGYWVSVCRAVECHWLSMVELNPPWWLDSKLRHYIDYQRCHGVCCAHGVRSCADVGSRIFSCLLLIWSECGLSEWLYYQGVGQKVLTKIPREGDIRWPGIEGAWRPFHSQRRLVRRVKRWAAELRRKKVIFRFWR